ncbi:MAG: glycosyltransferase family 4 protein [Chloroflexi bacterium]|nr:glycosyltransferase family 4 protein [Chloroflexota bacterium]MYB23423.1 glycosyltransferase family 4 protein [Chloroflexota bacterium]MYF23489.1 glycosyltransferase family 4 protein [Chloroflexota bacterium]MYF81212.1 glycosyltransferase family 4 protein [Chloroflexota bacterium]MYI03937.1 glycosyltransferase family 4 protein [Chloroflexota bacterium]
MPRVYVCSATGALTTDAAPVGGGVAVLEALIPHLRESDCELTLLTPGREASLDGFRQTLPVDTLSISEPDRILDLNARGYARFAIEWQAALSDYFADINPIDAVVIANDTSEGPPFAHLQANGFRQMALLHVIVSEFFSRRYISQPMGLPLNGAHLSALWRLAERRGIARHAPDIARLVWSKERDLARHVDVPIAPSAPVARSLADCYPGTGVSRRTQIVPWGVIGDADPTLREHRAETLRAVGADPNRFTLLTLSRISPEKRINLAIDALKLIERQSPTTAERIQLIVAGGPAYMGGEAYDRKLREDAERFRRVEVVFPGYIASEQKWRLLAAADTFLSPSYYEAYGLTIAQALASGTPVVATPHAGARATVNERHGWIAEATPKAFAATIRRALHADETREILRRREAAVSWAQERPFRVAAERIITIARTLAHGESPHK